MKHLKLYESYSLNNPIKKGDLVSVTMEFFEGKPTYEVEAKNDSWIHEGQEMFGFLMGGDMMMLAKKTDDKWFSN